MALLKCVECGHDVSDSSKVCQHCGCSTSKTIAAENDRKIQEFRKNMSPKEKKVEKIATIITTGILVLFILVIGKACMETIEETDDYNTESRAIVCAENAVEERLKSPSTADFCPLYEMTAENLGGDKWEVTGYVDAQNSFGAVVRQKWIVTLTLTEKGYKDCSVRFY